MSQKSHQLKPLLKGTHKRYAKAISHINAALNHSQHAIQGSTITAVLLIGLFKALVFKGRTFPAQWTTYVESSDTLLKLRGDDQLHLPLGCRLFHYAITNIRTSYAQRGVPVPSELSRIGQGITDPHSPYHLKHEDDWKVSTRTAPLVDTFAELRSAQLRLGAASTQEDTKDPAGFVRKCLDLNERLHQLIDKMPHTQRPATKVPSPEADQHAYRGTMHSFTSTRVVRQRNILHMLRLQLNEWVIETTTHAVRSGSDDETVAVTATCQCTAEDSILQILASVPYMIAKSYGTPPSPAAQFLIQPLNTVGVSSLASPEARLYVRRQLGFLGRKFNLPQADEAATVVEESSFRVESWLHPVYLS